MDEQQTHDSDPLPAVASASRAPRAWRRRGVTAMFIAPAAIVLVVMLVYPTIRTVIRSLFDQSGTRFVGLGNYASLAQSESLLTALRNNALWISVVPMLITAIGLVFAVLAERVSWAVAFKIAVFMPMAISLFAAGVIWRVTYDQDPNRGALNASIAAVHDLFSPSGVLTAAQPSTDALEGTPGSGFLARALVRPGDTVLLGLAAIPPAEIPQAAHAAAAAEAAPDAIAGTVWRDFQPGGGRLGVIDSHEVGLSGVTVHLRNEQGTTVASTKTGGDGRFRFDGVAPGDYRVAVDRTTFAQPFVGVPWLGRKLITPAIMIAYIWVWAGFAMVVIAAGLSALSREVLDAARIDGAREWQVFRYVTAPMLAPVLTVVFITLAINVLKIFDIVLSIAPGSSQDDASVIALLMWRVSFGGDSDFGRGAAIAVLLFLLVTPVLALNIRRFRREQP